MKYSFVLLLLIFSQISNGQKHTDAQTLNLDMSQYDMIHVYNTGGEVIVNGVQNDRVKIEAERILKASSRKRLDRAMNEIFIDTMVVDDELFVFINSPYKKLKADSHRDYLYYETPQDQWQNKNGIKQFGVESIFNMTINIPMKTSMVVSTHRGKLKIDNVEGDLVALNHHDDVKLQNVRNVKYAHSHHGDVEVDFLGQPANDISFDTHHGDIKISFPETPSAEVEFDSYHGSFYTDFQWTEMQPRFRKVKSKSTRKTKYKLGDKTVVSMGSGGQKLSFDSHHGDFYILKN